MGSFQCSITVLFAIGLKTYLRLEVDVPYLPASYSGDGTQDTTKINLSYPYVTITLYSASFQKTSGSQDKIKVVYNTTSPFPFEKGFSLPCAAFSRPYSQHLN